jgi:hypothetical protein
MTTSLDQALAALQHLQQENQSLREAMAQVQQTVPTPRPPEDPPRAHVQEPKISLPDKFDGNRSKFRGFINQVCLVIRLQPRRYPDGAAQVELVGTLLSGTALAWFAPLLEGQSPLLDDFESFVQEFSATFGDTDKERTSATKLRALQQGAKPASAYASQFRQLACDVHWGEAALISQFQFGLRGEVKDLLLTLPDPTTLSEAITQAVRCDNRLYERRQEKRLQPLHDHRPTPSPSFNPSPYKNNPMQVDSTQFKRLTEQEKQRRRHGKLCLYCGGPGHFASDCPIKGSQHRAYHVASNMTSIPTPESGNDYVQSQ